MDRPQVYEFVIAAIFWVAFAVGLTALETNWFRYGASLEGTAFFLTLSGITVLVAGLFAGLWVKRAPGAVSAITVSAVVLVLLAHRNIFGTWLPPLGFHDIASSPIQDVQAWGRRYRYHLELVDPFSRDHRERLVIEQRGNRSVINIPLFAHKVAGYSGPGNGGDWISLEPLPQPGRFVLTTTDYLKAAQFDVDVTAGTAVQMNGRQRP